MPITPSFRLASTLPCSSISSTQPVGVIFIFHPLIRTRCHISTAVSWIIRRTLHPSAGATRRLARLQGEWMVGVIFSFKSLADDWHGAAFRGELTSHHPHFHPASPAAVKDIDIQTAKELLPNALTVGIHMGLWFLLPYELRPLMFYPY